MHHDPQSYRNHHSNALLNWVLIGFLVVAGYSLVREHKAHLEGILYYLPYLLLLACPPMHLRIHHGHTGHGGHPSQKDDREEKN